MNRRKSAILCHLSSLPGRGGIGDLGEAAHQLLRWLQRAGQRGLQVLPTGPTGYGDSPYQLYSAFAGNPLFVSLELLCEQGFLQPADLEDAPPSLAHADFAAAQAFRLPRLSLAFQRLGQQPRAVQAEFAAYCEAERAWLDDFALFITLKEDHGGAPWHAFPAPLRDRDPAALAEAHARRAERVHFHRFVQWQYERQWRALREHARHLGIELIGDLPIFVAHDSVEVWQQRDQFLLHPDGRLRVQAGVPPDYFSATGQLWGNPLYDWERMRHDGFQFWRQRVRRALRLFDRVRIDHFRGFCAHWEIPGDARTAIDGRWVPAPGAELFAALAADLGGPDVVAARFIAEDLGIITPDVDALRDGLGLPGMRVLQFSFGDGDEARARPYGYARTLVFYTSTHDNDTLASWLRGDDVGPEGRSAGQAQRERDNVLAYAGVAKALPLREQLQGLWRMALGTVADTVILPVQDVLCLTTEARMNFPGRPAGNWRFRLLPGQLPGVHGSGPEPAQVTPDDPAPLLHQLCHTYGRLP